MSEPFRSFVIFAEMRTGSNLLEATLNGVKGVTCFGEAFNPYMMGWPDKDEMLGITRAAREADPLPLLTRLTDRPGHLPGFRYFHDHDPRVLEPIIQDRRCAKIILTRNPLDSYVSTRLAWETNQWKLNETETPIPARITYDGAEFRQMLSAMGEFRSHVVGRLQATGQVAFHLDYDDLRDAAVMTGLLHWLGRSDLEYQIRGPVGAGRGGRGGRGGFMGRGGLGPSLAGRLDYGPAGPGPRDFRGMDGREPLQQEASRPSRDVPEGPIRDRMGGPFRDGPRSSFSDAPLRDPRASMPLEHRRSSSMQNHQAPEPQVASTILLHTGIKMDDGSDGSIIWRNAIP